MLINNSGYTGDQRIIYHFAWTQCAPDELTLQQGHSYEETTLVSNALILLRLSQFWLEAIYGFVILLAVAADSFVLRRLRRTFTGRRTR